MPMTRKSEKSIRKIEDFFLYGFSIKLMVGDGVEGYRMKGKRERR